MKVEQLEQILSQLFCEYHIEINQIHIYSKNYKKIIKNEEQSDMIQYENFYYSKKQTTLKIDNNIYYVQYLEDVTKYMQLIFHLKKDNLTGLANREELEKYIGTIIKPKVFVMLDIDDFKKINDKYGHQEGDKVLKLLGHIIQKSIRNNDFAGRYGGEEFLIIFDTKNIDSIKRRIDKMNKEFNKLSEDLSLTFSAGISLYGENKKIVDVIKEADIALYQAKNNGKNSSVIYKIN